MHSELRLAFDPIIAGEAAPNLERLLALGQALLAAHLGFLADKHLLGDHEEATITMNLVYAAVRLQHPRRTDEERARVNDHGYLHKQLAGIDARGLWPTVRGEFVKFSKRVFQELKHHTPQAPTPLPLTGLEAAVLEVIRQQPPGQGISGKNVVAALAKRGFCIEQSTRELDWSCVRRPPRGSSLVQAYAKLRTRTNRFTAWLAKTSLLSDFLRPPVKRPVVIQSPDQGGWAR